MSPRSLAAATVALAAALALNASAPPATAGGPRLEGPGRVVFEIRQNGAAALDPDVEIAIRVRDSEMAPPVVVAEARRKTSFELPPGNYDCLVNHEHLFTRPLRFHRFTVRPGTTTTVVSDVRTHALGVVPWAAGRAAYDRVRELVVENTQSGEKVRFPGAGPLILPEAQYKVRLVARPEAADGPDVTREKTLYLACDDDLRLEL